MSSWYSQFSKNYFYAMCAYENVLVYTLNKKKNIKRYPGLNLS